MKRTALAATLVLAASAGIGYFVWAGRIAAGPPPVPAELTDPLARKLVEEKRQAVLTAPRSAAAWGETGMAFDVHELPAEAMICYRRALDLDPYDARWPFLLASQLSRTGNGADKEEALRLYRRSSECPAVSRAQPSTALLMLADLLTELGRGSEAAPIYQQVFSADRSNPWAAYRVGMALAERGETDQAAQIFLSLARNPFAQKKSAIAMAELSRRTGKAKDAEGFAYAAGLLPTDQNWSNPFLMELSALWRGRRALMQRYVEQEAAHDNKATLQTATALADLYPSIETQLLLLRAYVNAGNSPAAVAVADDILRDENGRKLATAHSFLGLARIGLADRAEAEGRTAEAKRLLAQAAEALGESVQSRAGLHVPRISLPVKSAAPARPIAGSRGGRPGWRRQSTGRRGRLPGARRGASRHWSQGRCGNRRRTSCEAGAPERSASETGSGGDQGQMIRTNRILVEQTVRVRK